MTIPSNRNNIHSNWLDVFQLQIKYTRLLDWLWQSRFWERNLRLCTSAFLISTFSKLTIKTSKKSRRKICAGRKTIFHGSKNQGKWCKSWVLSSRVWCLFFLHKKKLIVPRSKQKLHFHIFSICTCTQCMRVQANHAPVYPLATDGLRKQHSLYLVVVKQHPVCTKFDKARTKKKQKTKKQKQTDGIENQTDRLALS